MACSVLSGKQKGRTRPLEERQVFFRDTHISGVLFQVTTYDTCVCKSRIDSQTEEFIV